MVEVVVVVVVVRGGGGGGGGSGTCRGSPGPSLLLPGTASPRRTESQPGLLLVVLVLIVLLVLLVLL